MPNFTACAKSRDRAIATASVTMSAVRKPVVHRGAADGAGSDRWAGTSAAAPKCPDDTFARAAAPIEFMAGERCTCDSMYSLTGRLTQAQVRTKGRGVSGVRHLCAWRYPWSPERGTEAICRLTNDVRPFTH